MVGLTGISGDVAVDLAVQMSLTLRPKNVTKSCTIWVEAGVVGSAGGDSMLLTLDHSARASCLNSEIAIADLQYSAYLVWNSER